MQTRQISAGVLIWLRGFMAQSPSRSTRSCAMWWKKWSSTLKPLVVLSLRAERLLKWGRGSNGAAMRRQVPCLFQTNPVSASSPRTSNHFRQPLPNSPVLSRAMLAGSVQHQRDAPMRSRRKW